MNAVELISLLHSRDVKLSVDEDRLRCDAPKGVLTAELHALLVQHKAEVIAKLRSSALNGRGGTPSLRPVPREAKMTLSSSQRRLWLLDQIEGQSIAYHISGGFELEGALDVQVLERSLEEIVRRHESLRTTFGVSAGEPFQCVRPPAPFSLRRVDLTSLPADQRERRAERLMLEEARREFDLERGPLFRGTLVRMDEEVHLLMLSMHHIISDGWSLGVLLRELLALYEAGGASSTLKEPPLQYVDYAAWQREWAEGPEIQAQLDYWRRHLGGGLPPLELPTDHARPPVQTSEGAVHRVTLSADLLASVKRLGQRSGCTPFMALLAAFEVLLHRYTGQDDLVVGTPVANRPRAEVEGVVGFFVNMLPLRVGLSGDPSFAEVLGRVRAVALEAYAHQEVPFERVVEAVGVERDASRSPLFQVMFVLQNAPLELHDLPGLRVSPVVTDPGTAKYDLTLTLWEEPGAGLLADFEYRTDLFEAATIERMAGHYVRLLESAVADPSAPVSALEMLSAAERERLLVGWNDTDREYPRERRTDELVSAQAARTPGAVAVTDAHGQRLTYADLEARANRLAHYLHRLGVGPGALVGVCLERSADLVVALLAVMKAGAGYVPMDPAFPALRLAMMAEDAALRALVTDRAVAAALEIGDYAEAGSGDSPLTAAFAAAGTHLVRLDADAAAIERESDAPPEAEAGPGDIAYVIFTSGSTGRPKGVTIEHRALTNFLWSMRVEPGLREGDALVAVTTASFDIAALELYLPLITGARVVVGSRSAAADGAALLALVEQEAETLAESEGDRRPVGTAAGTLVLQATPVTWRMLLEAGWLPLPEGVGSRMLCGGEALPPALAEALLDRAGPEAELWNMYGPTETTIWSAVERVSREDVVSGRVPIGRPIANTTAYVLDAVGQPVPVGVTGTLYLGGAGVARGYFGRSDLTEEQFVADPFRPRAEGARMYNTGDLARWLPDGRLECLGRLDHQVKVRGYRIELGEVEAALEAHAAVAQAVVTAREDRPGDRRLVAYVVPAPASGADGALLDAGALRAHLKGRLPEYMVPAAFVALASLPQTPNGKVNRKALPAPEGGDVGSGAEYVAPRTATEAAVARVWAEVLGVERVGIRDNFFELGGHSLMVVQAHTLLKKRFDDLTVAQFFQFPTVQTMAEHLSCEGDDVPSFESVRSRAQKQKAALRRRRISN